MANPTAPPTVVMAGTFMFSSVTSPVGITPPDAPVSLEGMFDASLFYLKLMQDAGRVITRETSWKGKSFDGMTLREIFRAVSSMKYEAILTRAKIMHGLPQEDQVLMKELDIYNDILHARHVLEAGAAELLDQKPVFRKNGSEVEFPRLAENSLLMRETRNYTACSLSSPGVTRMSAMVARHREANTYQFNNRLKGIYGPKNIELASGVKMQGIRQMHNTPLSEKEKVLVPVFNRVASHGFNVDFKKYTVTSTIQREDPVIVDMTEATDDEGDDKGKGKGKGKESKKRPREDCRILAREYSHKTKTWYIQIAYTGKDDSEQLVWKPLEEVERELPEMYNSFIEQRTAALGLRPLAPPWMGESP
jgi:hypothetical protein